MITNAAGEVLAEGHDGIRGMYAGLFENSPQLAGRVVSRIAVGGFVADHEAIEGLNLPDVPTSVDAIAVYQVSDEKINRVSLYF